MLIFCFFFGSWREKKDNLFAVVAVVVVELKTAASLWCFLLRFVWKWEEKKMKKKQIFFIFFPFFFKKKTFGNAGALPVDSFFLLLLPTVAVKRDAMTGNLAETGTVIGRPGTVALYWVLLGFTEFY